MDNYWINIWEVEPPRNEDILFMIGDEEVHLGSIFTEDKLRKCQFHSYLRYKDYACDKTTPMQNRVIYWHPLPTLPEKNERGD